MRMSFYVMFMLLISRQMFASGYNNEVWRALSHGAEFDVRFQVVDDEGGPVSGAKCSGWKYIEYNRNHGEPYSCVTDTNGFVRIDGKCGERFSLVIKKEKYYVSTFEVKYPAKDIDPSVKDGKWQPYGATKVVVLKRIRQPHEMLGPKRTPQRKIKYFDKWLAFDLEKGDFLPPMGVGSIEDALIRFHVSGQMPDDWSITMDVTFTNHPYAGAYRLKKDQWSDLKSAYNADTNAIYQTTFSFKYCHEKGVYPYSDKLKNDEYMVFRIRTTIDQEGRLRSARYGKLYGPWHFEDAGGARVSGVFLNRQDNDVNLEDAR